MVGEGSKASFWNYISHHAPRPQGVRYSLKPETWADPQEQRKVGIEELSSEGRPYSGPTAEVPAP